MRVFAVVVALLVSGPCLATERTGAGSGLCEAHETVYFQCSAAKARSISLCGAAGGALQYRFGRRQAVELAFPADAKEGAKSFRYAHYFRAQTDRYEISFENHGVEYVLFDYQESDHREAGVRVAADDGKEREVACTGPVKSSLPALQGVVPCDAESALNLGRCP